METREQLPIDHYAAQEMPADPMSAHMACRADCIRLSRYIKHLEEIANGSAGRFIHTLRHDEPEGWPDRATMEEARNKESDSDRLDYLERLFTHLPHVQIIFNDDPDVEEPLGWTIRAAGCEIREMTAPTFRECIDKDMAVECDCGGEPHGKFCTLVVNGIVPFKNHNPYEK